MSPLLHLPLKLAVLVRRRLVTRMTSMAGVEVTAGEEGEAYVACPGHMVTWKAARILRDEGFDLDEDSTLIVVRGWRQRRDPHGV